MQQHPKPWVRLWKSWERTLYPTSSPVLWQHSNRTPVLAIAWDPRKHFPKFLPDLAPVVSRRLFRASFRTFRAANLLYAKASCHSSSFCPRASETALPIISAKLFHLFLVVLLMMLNLSGRQHSALVVSWSRTSQPRQSIYCFPSWSVVLLMTAIVSVSVPSSLLEICCSTLLVSVARQKTTKSRKGPGKQDSHFWMSSAKKSETRSFRRFTSAATTHLASSGPPPSTCGRHSSLLLGPCGSSSPPSPSSSSVAWPAQTWNKRLLQATPLENLYAKLETEFWQACCLLWKRVCSQRIQMPSRVFAWL